MTYTITISDNAEAGLQAYVTSHNNSLDEDQQPLTATELLTTRVEEICLSYHKQLVVATQEQELVSKFREADEVTKQKMLDAAAEQPPK